MYETFSIKLQYSVFVVQLIVHVSFFYFLFLLFKIKSTNIIDFFLFLTPFCLWGFFSDAAIGARKDGILWLLFLVFVYFLSQKKLSKVYQYFFYGAFAVSVFIHESFVFYAHYFVIATYYFERKINVQKWIIILLSFYLPAAIVLWFGHVNINYIQTLKLIKESGIILQKENIFVWKETEFIKIDFYKKHYQEVNLYAISFIFQMLFTIYYMYLKPIRNKKKLLVVFFISIVITLPLFLIAIDTGRWFYNHFTLFYILLVSLLPAAETKKTFIDFQLLKNPKRLVFILIILLACFVYRVPSYMVGIQEGLPLRLFLSLMTR
ncbi:hypothetical protein [Chryseobacterium wangxinyae]|uniref:hypothetical protein n=1 Tax=Chryseobacterium sp. CY353 TaxID=2997334 RepID=UPI002271308D|nr:hypothetical protein [Chryseobacterium sp. CY353]MCY0969875.1 hypothetical protein [Chryseobacterium sp. CY353]